jgi:hypothetical protein
VALVETGRDPIELSSLTVDLHGVLRSLNSPIALLSRHSGGNVHARETTEIIGSNNCGAAKTAADLDRDSSFGSTDRPWSSICSDFNTVRVAPTSDAIRTDSTGKDHRKNESLKGRKLGRTGRYWKRGRIFVRWRW